ncbi:MAG: rod shape-determining protein RodA [Dysgonamonadaceae bacterium]|jgi:rod shape determining protein RodA|nr:rod shape-determining protein RodA [Dysgonamonadaceae bacterium]
MPYRKINVWTSLDWWTVILFFVLFFIGWLAIYSASSDFDHTGMMTLSGRSGNQLLWIFISLIVGCSILIIDDDWYSIFAYWIYAFIILLLIVTIFLAPDIKGSRSWLVIGNIYIQPAEFSKFATALALAKFLNQFKFNLMNPKNFLIALGLICLPIGLILLQWEAGSALVFLVFFLVLYREGMPGMIILIGICMTVFFILSMKYAEVFFDKTVVGQLIVLVLILLIAIGYIFSKKNKQVIRNILFGMLIVAVISTAVYLLYVYDLTIVLLTTLALLSIYLLWLAYKFWMRDYLFVVLFILFSISFLYSVDYVFDDVLKPHQQVRLQVALGMKDDPTGANYNVNQSKIAIGSGGLWGKGYLNGTQTKMNYVPEQDTDFIFCTIGEEDGFVGTTFVLLLYLALILRLIYLAERQRSTFNRVYGYSVASIIFFHVVVNIGMVIGITPVIGIPLCFFSYGGSSFLSFSILLFIFLRLDASRNERL